MSPQNSITALVAKLRNCRCAIMTARGKLEGEFKKVHEYVENTTFENPKLKPLLSQHKTIQATFNPQSGTDLTQFSSEISRYTLIPFGMENDIVINLVKHQVQNIKDMSS